MKLEEMCLKITDGSHFSPKEALTGYPMLSVKDMGDYDFCYDGCKYINEVDYLGMVNGGCIPQLNDILVAKDGNSSLEHIFIVREQREEAILSSIAIIRPNPEIVQPEYLCYVLKNPVMNKLIKDNYISGSAIPRVVLKDFKKIEILLPPLPVQKKIASILSSLDDKIELNTRMNKVLEEIARALFQRWFVAFEFPDAEGKPYKSAGGKMVESEMGRVPEGWNVQPVSKLLTINPKLSLKKGQNASFVDMAALPMNSGSVSEVIMKEYGGGGSKFQNGDVLLARITPCLENGKTAIVDFLSEGEIGFGSTEFIVLRGEGVISTTFVYSLARDPEFRGHCIASMVGSSGRQRIQNACFGDFLVARPPDEVFERFNEIGMRLFNMITINTQQNKDLASMRDALLPKLMSRELNITS